MGNCQWRAEYEIPFGGELGTSFVSHVPARVIFSLRGWTTNEFHLLRHGCGFAFLVVGDERDRRIFVGFLRVA